MRRACTLTARQYSKLPIYWNGFLHSPGRWTRVLVSWWSCPDDWVPIDGTNLSCQEFTFKVALQKTITARNLSRQAYWRFGCHDKTVRPADQAIYYTVRVKVRAVLKLSWYRNLSCYKGCVTEQDFVDFGAFLKVKWKQRFNCQGKL
jgi:hypothetical protein